jgi:hypothetical protein
VLLGDLHLGNAGTDENLVMQVAQRLQEPGTYWIDLGDACDFINVRDPRFDPTALPDWVEVCDLADLPSAQTRRYVDIFKPVMSTCLVRLCGNHEGTIRQKYERDIYTELNRLVGLPRERALGYGGFMRLRVYRQTGHSWTLTFFLHHGAGGGQLAGAKALRLERLPMAFEADIYAIGHTHTKLVLQKRRVGLNPRGNKLIDKPLIMVNVGAFMRAYTAEQDGYAERKMLYPQGLGPVEVWIWPDKKILKVVQ